MTELAWERRSTGRGTSCRVLQGGDGPDLVFLHGADGLRADDELLARLARSFRIHAPELPGFGESQGEELLEDMLDFTLHGWDMVDALGIDRPLLIGHSMGGMIAAEMACICPERPARLALLAPAGLWLDSHPVADIFAKLPHELPALLFHDPAHAAALGAGFDMSDDQALIAFFVDNARRLGTAGKILFPIPNRRLSKRLYRLRAPTLLVWGESDQVVPPVYAEAWRQLVPAAEVALVPEAGHLLTIEQADQVAGLLEKFGAG